MARKKSPKKTPASPTPRSTAPFAGQSAGASTAPPASAALAAAPAAPPAAPPAKSPNNLIRPSAPPDCASAFLSGLPAFLSGGVAGSVVSETYVGVPPSIPSPAAVGIGSGPNPGGPDFLLVPIQAFVLSLTDAAHNTGVISPATAGWRFFAGNPQTNTAVLGRVVQRAPGQPWKLSAVHYGNLVWETLDSLNSAPGLNSLPPQVQGEAYELRMLSIPALNLEVFWLAAHKAGLPDFVVPVPSAAGNSRLPGFGSVPPLDMPHFLDSIRQVAVGLLKMPARSGA